MRDVMIEIKGRQSVDGFEQEIIEMMIQGSMEISDNLIVLNYDESGDDGSVNTTLSVEATKEGEIVTLDRSGSDTGSMTIQRGKRHMSLYQMGPCEFTVGVFGEKLSCNLSERGGKLNMRYTIDINSLFASRNEVDITVSEITN